MNPEGRGVEIPSPVLHENDLGEEFKDFGFKPYFPEINDVVRSLLRKMHFKTLKENETDNESLHLYIEPDYKLEIIQGQPIYSNELRNPETAGIYIRDESEIKAIIDREFNRILREMLEYATEYEWTDKKEGQNLIAKLNHKIQRIGTKNSEIKEIMNAIRRKTFIDRKEINPDSHIPLRSGLLNVKTWAI